MRINITEEHSDAWVQEPPEKRIVISDTGIPGFQAWREPSGRISFRYRYVSPITGKRQSFTIGNWPAFSLNDAKIKALEFSISVQKDKDPKLEDTGVTTELTLKQLLTQMVNTESALFRRTKGAEGIAPRTNKDYQRYLSDHYGPLSDLPVTYLQKNPHVILNHISAIRSKGSFNMARLVKASMSSAFSWGIQGGLLPVPINPCIAQYRIRQKKTSAKGMKRFLSLDEIKHLIISLDSETKGKTVNTRRKQFMLAGMVRLMLYTGVRPNEAAGAFIDEFDLNTGKWTLPGFRSYQWNDQEFIRRTKNGTDLILPLPVQAIQLVKELKEAAVYYSP